MDLSQWEIYRLNENVTDRKRPAKHIYIVSIKRQAEQSFEYSN